MNSSISLLSFTKFFKPHLNLKKHCSVTYAEAHINEYTCLNILFNKAVKNVVIVDMLTLNLNLRGMFFKLSRLKSLSSAETGGPSF